MSFLLRLIIFSFTILVAGCGINGQPLSPSEASSLGKKETLFPLNSSDSDASQEAPQVQSQSYVRRNELEQRGSDYSANFGLHNDTLNDVFERIKPKSAILKKRAITPLKRGYQE